MLKRIRDFYQSNTLSKNIFFLFLFFLPQQFGPHFWLNFSLVRGIRVDYLSPAFYISDLLLILLFFTSFQNVFKNTQVKKFLSSKLFVLFFIILFIPLLYVLSPLALLFGVLKFLEFLFLALYAFSQISKKDILPISFVFVFVATLESILAISQSLRQQSIGGLLYFLGERAIYPSTIGAAVTNTFEGLKLRPYGTFPHPNVLSFYLFTSFVFGTYLFSQIKKHKTKLAILSVLSIIQIGIFISFSRILTMLNVFYLLYLCLDYLHVKNFRKYKSIGFPFVVFGLLFLVYFSNSVSKFFMFSNAVIQRVDLISVSFKVLTSFVLFGTGLNNYLYHQVGFQKNFSQIFLQPVHNIYLLILLQVGIVGLGIALYFFYKTGKHLFLNIRSNSTYSYFYRSLGVLFIALLFVGFFDHYLITIQQGQLLTAFILGLCWNKQIH